MRPTREDLTAKAANKTRLGVSRSPSTVAWPRPAEAQTCLSSSMTGAMPGWLLYSKSTTSAAATEVPRCNVPPARASPVAMDAPCWTGNGQFEFRPARKPAGPVILGRTPIPRRHRRKEQASCRRYRRDTIPGTDGSPGNSTAQGQRWSTILVPRSSPGSYTLRCSPTAYILRQGAWRASSRALALSHFEARPPNVEPSNRAWVRLHSHALARKGAAQRARASW